MPIPDGADFAWADGQSETVRAAARIFTGRDSVLLVPGQLMTIGFAQPVDPTEIDIEARPTSVSLVASFLSRTLTEVPYAGVVVALSKCSIGSDLPLDATPDITSVNAAIGTMLSCYGTLFSSKEGALQLANEIVGAGAHVDAVTVQADANLAEQAAGLAGKLRTAAAAVEAVDIGNDIIDYVADEYSRSQLGDDAAHLTLTAIARSAAPQGFDEAVARVSATKPADLTRYEYGNYSPTGAEVHLGGAHFRSPSGNIQCSVLTENPGELYCYIQEHTFADAPDPGCGEGSSYVEQYVRLRSSGADQQVCTGGLLHAQRSNVLPYGSALRFGSFACASEESGVTCLSTEGRHGFALSRESLVRF